MITFNEIEQMILRKLPGAKVRVEDMNGTGDHFDIEVVSDLFSGKSLIVQHKMVFEALGREIDGRIHAVKLKTRAI